MKFNKFVEEHYYRYLVDGKMQLDRTKPTGKDEKNQISNVLAYKEPTEGLPKLFKFAKKLNPHGIRLVAEELVKRGFVQTLMPDDYSEIFIIWVS